MLRHRSSAEGTEDGRTSPLKEAPKCKNSGRKTSSRDRYSSSSNAGVSQSNRQKSGSFHKHSSSNSNHDLRFSSGADDDDVFAFEDSNDPRHHHDHHHHHQPRNDHVVFYHSNTAARHSKTPTTSASSDEEECGGSNSAPYNTSRRSGKRRSTLVANANMMKNILLLRAPVASNSSTSPCNVDDGFAPVRQTDQDQFVKSAALGLVDKVIDYLSNNRYVIDINGLSSTGNTALHAAVLPGSVQCTELLIQKGANCEVENKDGWPPLHVACKGNWHKLVPILLAGGAKINTRNKALQTPLHIAVLEGCKETVDLLIKRGAITSFQDKDGNTPLHIAVLKRNDFITSTLLEHDASSVTVVNNNGFNVLHYAAKYGYTKGVELILQHLIHGNHVVRTRSSRSSVTSDATLLVSGSPSNSNLPLAALGNRRWIIDEPKQDGFTALHIAMVNGHCDVVTLLLKNGARINIQAAQTGSTPLHVALEERQFKAAIAFLKSCPGDPARALIPDLPDSNGSTALHKALSAYSEAHKTRKASLRMMKRKQTMNSSDEDVADDSEEAFSSSADAAGVENDAGQHALQDCAYIILTLVQLGGSLTVKNKRGKTPLDFCSDPNFVELLRKRASKLRKDVERQSISHRGSTSGAGNRESQSRASVATADLRHLSLSHRPSMEPPPTPGGRKSSSSHRKGSQVQTLVVPGMAEEMLQAPMSPRRSVAPTVEVTSRPSVSTKNHQELGRRTSGNVHQGSPSGLPRISIAEQLTQQGPPPPTPLLPYYQYSATSPVPPSPAFVFGPTVRKSSLASTVRGHHRTDSDGALSAISLAVIDERERTSQMLQEIKEEAMCPVCKSRPRRLAFIPCGHFFCQPCGDNMTKCATCRREVGPSDKLELR